MTASPIAVWVINLPALISPRKVAGAVGAIVQDHGRLCINRHDSVFSKYYQEWGWRRSREQKIRRCFPVVYMHVTVSMHGEVLCMSRESKMRIGARNMWKVNLRQQSKVLHLGTSLCVMSNDDNRKHHSQFCDDSTDILHSGVCHWEEERSCYVFWTCLSRCRYLQSSQMIHLDQAIPRTAHTWTDTPTYSASVDSARCACAPCGSSRIPWQS